MCHESFMLKSSTVHQRSHFKIYGKKGCLIYENNVHISLPAAQSNTQSKTKAVWKKQNANTRYNSLKLSRANIRLLNGDYTNASRTTLCSHYLRGEQLYNYDVSPFRYTCPNPCLTGGGDLEPGVRAVYSI